MNYIKFILILVSFALLGCSAPKNDTSIMMSGINDIFVLQKIKDANVQKQGRKSAMLEIHVAEKKFYGNTSCNEMQGSVEVGKTSIKFSDYSATKMFCDDSVETEFVAALLSADSWRYENMTLFLIKGGEVVLTFKKVD